MRRTAKHLLTRLRTSRWRRRRAGHPDAVTRGLRVLLYHRVADEDDELALGIASFAEQMELLADRGYRVLDVVQALDALYAGEPGERVVALTFDDGYVDTAVNAEPILERHGFRATVFVASGVASGVASFAEGSGSPAPVLGWDEIRGLEGASALTFEAHSVSHPDLTRLGDEACGQEIEGSKDALERELGRPARAFCYPGGFFGAREAELAREAGFRYAITCEPGLNTPDTDPMLVRRVQIDPSDRLVDFAAKVEGSHDRPLAGRRLYRRVRYGASDPLRAVSGPAETAAVAPPVPPASAGSLAQGSALLLVTQVLANAGFFVAVLLLARGLEPAQRGTIAFVTLSILVLGLVARLGIPEATQVFAAQRVDRRPALLANVTLSSLALCLVAALAFVALLRLLDVQPAGVGATELLLVVLFAPVTGVAESLILYLIGVERPREAGLLNAIQPWLYAAGLAALAIVGEMDVVSAALAWGLAMTVALVVMLVVSLRLTGAGWPSWSLLRESVRFGLPASLGGVARFLNFRADQLIMAFIAAEAVLGVYAVAVNGSEILLYLPSATALAIVPLIATVDPGERADRALQAFRVVMLITVPAVVLAMLLGPLLIPAFFGDAYEGSVTPFVILAPGAVGYAAIAVFSGAALGGSAPLRSSVGFVVAFVVGVALVLVLVPRYDATGAALASTTAFLLGGVAQLVTHRGHVSFPLRALVPTGRDVSDSAQAVGDMWSRLRRAELSRRS